MKINKQLFEDVLSGKLKGKFVFRNQLICNSEELTKNSIDKYNFTYPYRIRSFSYMPNGIHNFYCESDVDIINFIPNTNMKENELTIEIPEGYEIDKENSTFEKIVFKKKDTKPRSWEEYYEQHRKEPHFVLGYDVISGYSMKQGIYESGYYTVPSRELAKAFIAMMQLMSLRQAWIGDWNSNRPGYAIMLDVQRNLIVSHGIYHKALTFPDRNMAVDFMNTFKDLLNTAKSLI